MIFNLFWETITTVSPENMEHTSFGPITILLSRISPLRILRCLCVQHSIIGYLIIWILNILILCRVSVRWVQGAVHSAVYRIVVRGGYNT